MSSKCQKITKGIGILWGFNGIEGLFLAKTRKLCPELLTQLFLLPEDAAPSEFASRLVSGAVVFLVHGLSRPERNIVMILIRKVADDYGWLGNISSYPLRW